MKTKVGLLLAFPLIVSLSSQQTFAGTEGEKLHNQKCMTCHKLEVYQRKNKKVSTLAALKARVGNCAKLNKTGWNDTQIGQVIKYLNSSFYKFSVYQ